MMNNQEKHLISINDFCLLAEKLLVKGLFDDAITLYNTACKIFPDSIALRLNLSRAKELKRKFEETNQKKEIESVEAKKREEEQLSSQMISLARIYMQKKEYVRAITYLETAKELNPNISLIRVMLGKVFYENLDIEKAIEEFLYAKEIDPFNEEVCWLLGKIFFERKEYWKALENFSDAKVLAGNENAAKKSYYAKQIKLILSKLNSIEKEEYDNYINKRKEYFNKLAHKVNKKRESYLTKQIEGELDYIFSKLPKLHIEKQDLLNKALNMKKISLLSSLRDEELFQLSKLTNIVQFKKDEFIFRDNDLTEDIYLVEKGEVRISKQTPYGEQLLALIKEGEYFGEMDFIDNMRCSADAIANIESNLYTISKIGLEELFIADKHIAIQFYWNFWKTLAKRIRDANELLKTFFSESKNASSQRKVILANAEPVSIDLEKKLSVLKEKGLSSSELRLLATFSKEERYYKDQVIFKEGDEGDKLYIIIDGQIRISKFIPGVGEEALAILERGEFFGEMALIDEACRSADAIVHSETVSLLGIQKEVLHQILSRDAESSYRFLHILCKILSNRLREINLKIYQWRMMLGSFT